MNLEFDFEVSADAAEVLASEAIVRLAIDEAQAQAQARVSAPPVAAGAKAAVPAQVVKPAKVKAKRKALVATDSDESSDSDSAELESQADADGFDGDLMDDSVSDLTSMSGDDVEDAARGTLKVLAAQSASGAESSQRYLNVIGRYKNLTAEEEGDLASRAVTGDAGAFEKLCNHNLRLVVAVARRYLNRGLPFDDLVQEGNMGLMRGIEKFKPELGYRLSTYATFWINQAIGRGVKTKASIIRVPTHIQDAATKHRRAAARARAEDHPDAGLMEAASYVETARTALIQNHASLSESVGGGDDDDRTLGDFLVDDQSDPELTIARRQTIELVFDCIRALPERSRFIVAARCDMLPDQAHTLGLETWIAENNLVEFSEGCRENLDSGSSLAALSEVLDLSRERINQIYRGSMEAMKGELGCSVNGLDNLAADIDAAPKRQAARRK